MGMITNMEQDEKIEALERKVKRLENKLNGGNGMSRIPETCDKFYMEINTLPKER